MGSAMHANVFVPAGGPYYDRMFELCKVYPHAWRGEEHGIWVPLGWIKRGRCWNWHAFRGMGSL